MKKLSLHLFLLAAVAAVPACKKSNGQNAEPPDTLQLLTEKPWKLLSYGYDYNHNGFIRSAEDHISSCQQKNVFVFNSNGTGLVKKNTLFHNSNSASYLQIIAV